MTEHEAEAMFQSTIREQVAAVSQEPVEEAILSVECMARLGVPLETLLGDLTEDQLGTFADWLNEMVEEMRRMADGLARLAAIRRAHKG